MFQELQIFLVTKQEFCSAKCRTHATWNAPGTRVQPFAYKHPDEEHVRLARIVATDLNFVHYFAPVTSEALFDLAPMSMWILEGNADRYGEHIFHV